MIILGLTNKEINTNVNYVKGKVLFKGFLKNVGNVMEMEKFILMKINKEILVIVIVVMMKDIFIKGMILISEINLDLIIWEINKGLIIWGINLDLIIWEINKGIIIWEINLDLIIWEININKDLIIWGIWDINNNKD